MQCVEVTEKPRGATGLKDGDPDLVRKSSDTLACVQLVLIRS